MATDADRTSSAAYRPAYTEKELDAVIAALDKLLEREEPSVVRIAEVALLAASAAALSDYDKLKALCYALFRSNIDWTHEAANCGDEECQGDCKYVRTIVETVREIDGGILR